MMKLSSAVLLFAWLTQASTANSNKDPHCRLVTSEDRAILSADVVVVGSGPGGAGFLHRFVRLRPDLSVIWIEKGQDFIALNWPEDIAAVNGEVMSTIPRKTMTWISGKAWNNFGGGDAGNSGGANYLVTEDPYDAVNVASLRNHSVIPVTDTTARWMKAFQRTGYSRVPPPGVKHDIENLVSQPSSLRTKDGRDRLLLANGIRYAPDSRVTYVHARAASVIRNEAGQAVGIRGVRVDGHQNEYGGCVAWKASTAVVLAGGVFNSFDLLVESGIGPAEYLEARDVPKDWWTPNEDVGKNVGDEHAVIFIGVEAEQQDPFGAQPRLIAEDTFGSAYEFWTKGLLDWFRFKNTNADMIVGSVVPRWFPRIFSYIQWFLEGCSMWGIGIKADPVMSIEAVPKPLNATQSVNRYMMYPFQNPLEVLKDKYRYRKNQLGLIVDDSKVTVTDEMCEAITNSMIPMGEGAKLQKEAKSDLGTKLRRFKLMLLTKLRLTELALKPNIATAYNLKRYAGKGKNKGKKCHTKMFASYYHYFGGNADVVDKNYQVRGVSGLFVSDGSVLRLLTPGPSSATIMQTGMRVADALVNSL